MYYLCIPRNPPMTQADALAWIGRNPDAVGRDVEDAWHRGVPVLIKGEVVVPQRIPVEVCLGTPAE